MTLLQGLKGADPKLLREILNDSPDEAKVISGAGKSLTTARTARLKAHGWHPAGLRLQVGLSV